MTSRQLVLGAGGFLGAHVTRQLVDRGADVRVLIRPTSDTRGIEDLPVQRCHGDILDADAVRAAMRGCDTVYHCAVDTRAWLTDPSPLYRTNVDGLRRVLDAALAADVSRFVYTSSVATIGRRRSGVVDERVPFNWGRRAGAYVASRVEAEELVLDYALRHALPAVAMCVANTYGPYDFRPTPHGAFVEAAALGRLPLALSGIAAESVGVEDAARALLLAANTGRPGQRYIVSERYLSARDLVATAAQAVGRRPPPLHVPRPAMTAAAAVAESVARVRGTRDARFNRTSIRLMHIMSAMDHGKATRELDWTPEPVHEAIARAAQFFVDERGRRLRQRAAGDG